MPTVAVLAAKYPRSTAALIPQAPMPQLHQFYVANVTEKALHPMVSMTCDEHSPLSIEVRNGSLSDVLTTCTHMYATSLPDVCTLQYLHCCHLRVHSKPRFTITQVLVQHGA